MIVDFHSHKAQDVLFKTCAIKEFAEYLKNCSDEEALEIRKKYGEKICSLSKEIIDLISVQWKIEVEVNVKEK